MSISRYGDIENFDNTNLPVFQYVSRSKYEHDWISHMHSHPFTEIAYIESGEGSVIIEDKAYPVSAGYLVIIFPNQSHTEISSDTNAMGYFFLGVKNIQFQSPNSTNELRFSVFGESSNYNYFKNGFILDLGKQRSTVRSIFADIFHEMQLKQKGYEIQVKSLFLQFFVFLLRYTELSPTLTNEDKKIGVGHRMCAIMREYIDAHYSDKLSIDFLAEKAGFSKYYFIREFFNYSGMTPIEYQLHRRIEESKNLLVSTELSIVDIAFAVGFSSASHFSQMFKQHEGNSPLQFRKHAISFQD